MAAEELERLHQEIRDNQQRRHKLDLLKITFVSALLGFGAVKVGDIVAFYQTLYLVPLVAVFFDLLMMGEHFSIRRLGAFLRLHSPDELEHQWEKFVSKNRDKFFKNGSRGFTLLSYVGAVALLHEAKGNLSWPEILWFIAILVVFIALIVYGGRRLERLDTMAKERQPAANYDNTLTDTNKPMSNIEEEGIKEVHSTVDNWFGESWNLIRNYHELTGADILLASVLLCARKHTIGVLLLLANNHKLSAQALLRVLCELYVKLVWTLGRPKKLSKDDIYKRFQRLDYSRVIEHRKILRNLAKSYPHSSAINESLAKAEKSIQDYDKRRVKALPDVAGIFAQIDEAHDTKDWIGHVYPHIYQDFSGAIHSDMRILRELVQYDEYERTVSYKHDVEYSIDKLKDYCVSMACDINLLIRDQYEGTDEMSEQMQKESRRILGGNQGRQCS
jgi:hypothetical protein